MTNSCSLMHFSFSHASVRPERDCVRSLGDDPFEAHAAGLGEDVLAGPFEMLAEMQMGMLSRNDGAQCLLPLQQGPASQIDAIEVECIEQIVVKPVLRIVAQGLLQGFERRRARHLGASDFAVHDGVCDRQIGHLVGDALEFLGPVVVGAREKSHFALADPAKRAIAVELDFMHPVVARRRLADRYGVASSNVHAYIVGEHGDSQIPVPTSARTAGVPLEAFCQQLGLPYEENTLGKIASETRTAGIEVIGAKGATCYG